MTSKFGLRSDRTEALRRLLWVPVLACFAGTPGAGSVPPPPQQFWADCGRPVYATDHLVCAEPDLRALDLRYRALVATPSDHLPISSQALWESDGDWFRRRSMCASSMAHEDCVRDAYESRIAGLQALERIRLTGGGRQVRCDGAWADLSVVRVDGSDGIDLFDAEGVLWLNAWGKTRTSAWTPFAAAIESPSTLTLSTQGGKEIHCK